MSFPCKYIELDSSVPFLYHSSPKDPYCCTLGLKILTHLQLGHVLRPYSQGCSFYYISLRISSLPLTTPLTCILHDEICPSGLWKDFYEDEKFMFL